MTTFGHILERNRGIGPGFDFARVFLALGVLGIHAWELVYGDAVDTAHGHVTWIIRMSILPMFFGLSGFLVAASAQRLDLRTFIANRGVRIAPALSVEIFLSALLLGPLLTSFDLRQYFTDPKFFIYFLNIVGVAQFKLPGVFLDNPVSGTVNGSLWTVSHEIVCYVVMSCVMMFGLTRRSGALLAIAAGFIGLAVLVQLAMPHLPDNAFVRAMHFRYWSAGLGPVLVPCFLLGAVAYNLRDRLPYDRRLAAGCAAFLLLVGALAPETLWEMTPVAALVCPAMVYLVCFVGLTRIPPLPFYGTGDYSYGIYLYGYPIQQTLLHLMPGAWNPVAFFLVSIVGSTAIAFLSWHAIEKPLLLYRKRASMAARLERRREPIAQEAGSAASGRMPNP